MALASSEIKAKFQQRIYNGLQRVFNSEVSQGKNYPPEAEQMWMKMADAISDIAIDLVTEITTNAEVVPGQAVVTVGGPTTQTGSTISPGKIL